MSTPLRNLQASKETREQETERVNRILEEIAPSSHRTAKKELPSTSTSTESIEKSSRRQHLSSSILRKTRDFKNRILEKMAPFHQQISKKDFPNVVSIESIQKSSVLGQHLFILSTNHSFLTSTRPSIKLSLSKKIVSQYSKFRLKLNVEVKVSVLEDNSIEEGLYEDGLYEDPDHVFFGCPEVLWLTIVMKKRSERGIERKIDRGSSGFGMISANRENQAEYDYSWSTVRQERWEESTDQAELDPNLPSSTVYRGQFMLGSDHPEVFLDCPNLYLPNFEFALRSSRFRHWNSILPPEVLGKIFLSEVNPHWYTLDWSLVCRHWYLGIRLITSILDRFQNAIQPQITFKRLAPGIRERLKYDWVTAMRTIENVSWLSEVSEIEFISPRSNVQINLTECFKDLSKYKFPNLLNFWVGSLVNKTVLFQFELDSLLKFLISQFKSISRDLWMLRLWNCDVIGKATTMLVDEDYEFGFQNLAIEKVSCLDSSIFISKIFNFVSKNSEKIHLVDVFDDKFNHANFGNILEKKSSNLGSFTPILFPFPQRNKSPVEENFNNRPQWRNGLLNVLSSPNLRFINVDGGAYGQNLFSSETFQILSQFRNLNKIHLQFCFQNEITGHLFVTLLSEGGFRRLTEFRCGVFFGSDGWDASAIDLLRQRWEANAAKNNRPFHKFRFSNNINFDLEDDWMDKDPKLLFAFTDGWDNMQR